MEEGEFYSIFNILIFNDSFFVFEFSVIFGDLVDNVMEFDIFIIYFGKWTVRFYSLILLYLMMFDF